VEVLVDPKKHRSLRGDRTVRRKRNKNQRGNLPQLEDRTPARSDCAGLREASEGLVSGERLGEELYSSKVPGSNNRQKTAPGGALGRSKRRREELDHQKGI